MAGSMRVRGEDVTVQYGEGYRAFGVDPGPPGNRTNFSIFFCRPRAGQAQCTDPGCNHAATAPCSFPLRGRKAGALCGRRVCKDHQGRDAKHPLCPPHQRLTAPK